MAQEAALLETLYTEIDKTPTKLTGSLVLDSAAKHNLGSLLTVCETHVIRHFDYYSHEKRQMESKLPPSSMLRTASFSHFKLGVPDCGVSVCEQMIKAYLRDPPPEQEASAVILR